MRSDIIYVTQKTKRLPVALETADAFARKMGMNRKQTVRLRLLTEETIGMLREMAGDYRAELWFEGENKLCELHLMIDTQMDADKKADLLSVSTTGNNESVHGFMGRMRNMIENMMLGKPETASRGNTAAWSLSDYRKRLESGEESEEWDELERSIVANIADDILVGVEKNSVSMVIRSFLWE